MYNMLADRWGCQRFYVLKFFWGMYVCLKQDKIQRKHTKREEKKLNKLADLIIISSEELLMVSIPIFLSDPVFLYQLFVSDLKAQRSNLGPYSKLETKVGRKIIILWPRLSFSCALVSNHGWIDKQMIRDDQ